MIIYELCYVKQSATIVASSVSQSAASCSDEQDSARFTARKCLCVFMDVQIVRSFIPTRLWRWDRELRNVGISNSDAGELPRRKHTTNRKISVVKCSWVKCGEV
jgi:hypothetical protein